MSTKQLEKRVSKLEMEFEQMKADFRSATSKGWRAIIGSHEGSETFEDVVREMRRLRREEYADSAEQGGESQE